jgi:hypothetical protein
VDPTGHVIVAEMPVDRYAGMTDDDLKAIWAFVKSVPPREFGNR